MGPEEKSAYLQEHCMRHEEFMTALIQSYEIMSIHRMWSNKMLCQRRAMAAQMEEMSRILFGCSIMLGFDKTKESKAEKTFRKLLKKQKSWRRNRKYIPQQ